MPVSNPFERTIDHQVQHMAPLTRAWKSHAEKSMPCLMNSLRYYSQQSLSNTIPKQHLQSFPSTLVDVVQNSIQNNTTKDKTSPAQNSVVYYCTRSIESSDIQSLFLPQKKSTSREILSNQRLKIPQAAEIHELFSENAPTKSTILQERTKYSTNSDETLSTGKGRFINAILQRRIKHKNNFFKTKPISTCWQT